MLTETVEPSGKKPLLIESAAADTKETVSGLLSTSIFTKGRISECFITKV